MTASAPASAKTSKFSLRSQIAGGALALGLIALSGPLLAAAQAPSDQVEAEIAAGHADQAIHDGEAALAKDPQDAALRAALGRAYLRTGRFESAAAMLSDAASLGSVNPRLALNLALADIATGHSSDAVAVLDQARDSLPVADFGLAVALAGDPGRGVSVLSDAIRAGDNSARLRQNLAYAHALDGHWAEARTAMQNDLTDNQIDARLTQWAAQARPDAARERVASLLGVANRSDSGVPSQLALAGGSRAPALAVAQPAGSRPANGGELPAVSGTVAAQAPVAQLAPQPTPQPLVAPAPQPAPQAAPADSSYSPPSFAAVQPAHAPQLAMRHPARPVAAPKAAKPLAAPVAASASGNAASDGWRNRFAALAAQHSAHAAHNAPHTIAHSAPAKLAHAAPVKAAHANAAPQRPALAMANGAGGHLVQLGAFSSAQNAERARHYFLTHNPAVRGHQLAITKAEVNGRHFWRVTSGGYTSVAAASGTCSSVKKRGGVCFAYAAAGQHGAKHAGKQAGALAMATPRASHGR